MEKDNIVHKYPYRIGDFFDNTEKYNFGPALQEDWYMTKERAKERLINTGEKVLFGLAMVVGIPIALYASYNVIKEMKRRGKLERRILQRGPQ